MATDGARRIRHAAARDAPYPAGADGRHEEPGRAVMDTREAYGGVFRAADESSVILVVEARTRFAKLTSTADVSFTRCVYA